jgi:hypothetical protein
MSTYRYVSNPAAVQVTLASGASAKGAADRGGAERYLAVQVADGEVVLGAEPVDVARWRAAP